MIECWTRVGNKNKQKLWDFAPKKKLALVTPKTIEKIIMVLISIVGLGIALYFLIKLIRFFFTIEKRDFGFNKKADYFQREAYSFI